MFLESCSYDKNFSDSNLFDSSGLAIECDSILLTKKQQMAIEEIKKWFKNKNKNKQFFSVGGYAGTGKTSIIKYIIEELKLKKEQVAVCSYSGKATLVLKRKGIENAKTIHQTIYNIKTQKNENGETEIVFKKKRSLSPAKLIIVDEASMIDESIHKDLIHYNIPILYIGDHYQLPPISGNFNVMENPDFKLEEILRQSENNPIIKIATDVRNNIEIPYFDSEFVKKIHYNDLNENIFMNADQLIAGTNDKRIKLNNFYREEILGIRGDMPKKNEKLVVLKNHYCEPKILYNGECLYVGDSNYSIYKNKAYYEKDFIDEMEMDSCEHSFLSNGYCKGLFTLKEDKDNFNKHGDKIIHADFGYCLTAHKAQGSQWNNVVVFDDGFGKWKNDNTYSRWLYTSITRAKEKLVIVSK